MRKHLPTLALTALATLAAGAAVSCGSPCQDLAERICACQPAGSSRDSCVASVKNQLGSGVQRPTSADETKCQDLLGVCPDPSKDSTACDQMNSVKGKQDCGLAYPPDAGAN